MSYYQVLLSQTDTVARLLSRLAKCWFASISVWLKSKLENNKFDQGLDASLVGDCQSWRIHTHVSISTEKYWGPTPSSNYAQTFLNIFRVRSRSRLAYTELCFLLTFLSFQPRWCFSDSLEKAQLGWCRGWGFPLGKEPGGLKQGDFQTHRCCWILVSRQEVWAHGSELFILWTRVPLPRHQATARLICNVWCHCNFQRLNKAEPLQRRATPARPREACLLAFGVVFFPTATFSPPVFCTCEVPWG